VSDGPSGDSCRSDNYGGQEKLKQWSHSEFSKIPRSCYEKSQDWTKKSQAILKTRENGENKNNFTFTKRKYPT